MYIESRLQIDVEVKKILLANTGVCGGGGICHLTSVRGFESP